MLRTSPPRPPRPPTNTSYFRCHSWCCTPLYTCIHVRPCPVEQALFVLVVAGRNSSVGMYLPLSHVELRVTQWQSRFFLWANLVCCRAAWDSRSEQSNDHDPSPPHADKHSKTRTRSPLPSGALFSSFLLLSFLPCFLPAFLHSAARRCWWVACGGFGSSVPRGCSSCWLR